MTGPQQLRLLGDAEPSISVVAVAAFDPARLTQARRLAGMTKRAVATEIGISAAAVGQWEAGTTLPRPDHLDRLSEILDVPVGILCGGTPARNA